MADNKPELISTIAHQVNSDIWDIFGNLTREQSVGLESYLQELAFRGILRMPEMGVKVEGPVEPQPADVPAPQEPSK